MRNWKKVQLVVKVVAFVLTVIVEAIKAVNIYAEREFSTAQ